MTYQQRLLAFVCLATFSLAAAAEDVYESIDEQGVIEFSDQASPGAEKVDVQPNVIDVVPVKPVQGAAPAAAGGATQPAESGQEIDLQGEEYIHDDDYPADAVVPGVRGERAEQRDEERVNREVADDDLEGDDAPGQATRNKARALQNATPRPRSVR